MSGDETRGPNHPHPYPILENWPEFWWMGEIERADAFEARALAHGGSGYRYHPELAFDHGRER
jgi:hypothetical protein